MRIGLDLVNGDGDPVMEKSLGRDRGVTFDSQLVLPTRLVLGMFVVWLAQVKLLRKYISHSHHFL